MWREKYCPYVERYRGPVYHKGWALLSHEVGPLGITTRVVTTFTDEYDAENELKRLNENRGFNSRCHYTLQETRIAGNTN